jgi:spore germination protein YaaH
MGRATFAWLATLVAAAALCAGAAASSVHRDEARAHLDESFSFTPGGAATVPLEARIPGGAEPLAEREVFGFLPYWMLDDPSLQLDYSALSTIAYFGVTASPSGDLVRRGRDGTPTDGWAGWRSEELTAIVDEAHLSGTRVVLTVARFAWTSGEAAATRQLLSRRNARLRLATEIAREVEARGVDGVNLDFEPIPAGQSRNFVRLVRAVRRALDAGGADHQLTVAATAHPTGYQVEALTAADAADALFVMGYDYRWSGSSRAGAVAPLAGPSYDLGDSLSEYMARAPAEKIILGLPYYGRLWATVSGAPNARTHGRRPYAFSRSVRYSEAVAIATRRRTRYDAVEHARWMAFRGRACARCPRTWFEIYYDDAQSLAAKYDLVNARRLRGVGIWALGYDGLRPELYDLLHRKFRPSTAAGS